MLHCISLNQSVRHKALSLMYTFLSHYNAFKIVETLKNNKIGSLLIQLDIYLNMIAARTIFTKTEVYVKYYHLNAIKDRVKDE